MKTINVDTAIVGGGPAGMSAGIGSAKNGSKTLIIDRNPTLGGILNQCIHNGFGLHYYKEELTGPEFANRLEKDLNKYSNVQVMLSSFVTNIAPHALTVASPDGIIKVKAKSIILATGAREKTPANISLAGTRPVGVYTAGTAQKMVNIYGKMPGKEIVILGSGDIGLIMARRLTLEGAKVKAVLEINPTPSGLRRNILQCLDDFGIPLYLSTTVFRVVGENRVEGIYFGQVDKNYNQIKESEKFLKCDCLILSVGLVPETDLLPNLTLQKVTNGGQIDEHYMTNLEGIFTCGNVLHIHDLVDNVCIESEECGLRASQYAKNQLESAKQIKVIAGDGLSYIVPSFAYLDSNTLTAKFRLKTKIVKSFVIAKSGSEIIAKKYFLAGTPGEMVTFEIDKSKAKEDIIVEVQK